MKKQIFVIAGLLLAITSMYQTAIFLNNAVNGQMNEKALRYEPNINEDEIIFCVKDTQHKAYYGQISCFVSPSDDLLDKQTTDEIYNKASSLQDTFEMGLID